MLNWIVRNKTIFDAETVLTLNIIVWNRIVLKLTVCKRNLYLYLTELVELELFVFKEYLKEKCLWQIAYSCEIELLEIEQIICVKIDLASKTYKGWYAMKPNQPNFHIYIYIYIYIYTWII